MPIQNGSVKTTTLSTALGQRQRGSWRRIRVGFCVSVNFSTQYLTACRMRMHTHGTCCGEAIGPSLRRTIGRLVLSESLVRSASLKPND
jgi:hypothetical protein